MIRAKPSSWKDYFERTKGRPPRPLLVKALVFVKDRGEALDLGSGALNDSRYLISEGFKHVTAVDKVAVATEIADKFPKDIFTYVISAFDNFHLPKDTFDLINAQYALPFISPEAFNDVFVKIVGSLKKDAILTGQFFGDRDEWKTDTKMTFLSLTETQNILKGLTVLSFEEEEHDKVTAAGEMKHWHVFNFIVRK